MGLFDSILSGIGNFINSSLNNEEEEEKKNSTTTVSPTVTTNTATTAGVTEKKENSTSTYQKMLSSDNTPQPVKNKASASAIVGSAMQLAETNPEMTEYMMTELAKAQNDPSSILYAPYNKVTNPSINTLNQYGIDTSNINDEWIQQYSWLNEYLKYGDSSNTPNKPSTKASDYEKAAYAYWGVCQQNDLTNKANLEWKAMQEEITFLSNWDELNLTPEEVLERLDMSKYPTLQAMDDSKQPGHSLLELNSVIGYNRDNMLGTVWAARNNGGTGNVALDAINYYYGENKWQYNPEIAAKLDSGNKDTYSPFSVSSTAYDVCTYMGIHSWNQQWLDEHRNEYVNSGDKTKEEMYYKAWDIETTTQKAETQLTDLNKQVDDWINQGYTYDEIQTNIDRLFSEQKSDYSVLIDMDKNIDKGEKGSNLVQTSRPVNYSRNDLNQTIREKMGLEEGKKTSEQTVGTLTGEDNTFRPKTEEEIKNEAAGLVAKGQVPPQQQEGGATTVQPTAPGQVNAQPEQNAQAAGQETEQAEAQPTPQPTAEKPSIQPMATPQPPQAETVPTPTPQPPQAEPTQPPQPMQPENPQQATAGTAPEPDEEAMRMAYDREHGEGAYDRDLQTAAEAQQAGDTKKEMTGQEKAEAEMSANARAVSSVLWNNMTEAEKNRFRSFPGLEAEQTTEDIYTAKTEITEAGPLNPKLHDQEWLDAQNKKIAAIVTAQAQTADSDYLTAGLNSLALRTNYEETEQKVADLQAELDDIEQNYSMKMMSREIIPEEVDVQFSDDMSIHFVLEDVYDEANEEPEATGPDQKKFIKVGDVSVSLEWNKDEKRYKVTDVSDPYRGLFYEDDILPYADEEGSEAAKLVAIAERTADEETAKVDTTETPKAETEPKAEPHYILDPYYDMDNPAVDYYLASNNMTMEDLQEQIDFRLARLNAHADDVRQARIDYPDLDEEEIAALPTQEHVDSIQKKLTDLGNFLESNREAYDEAVKELDGLSSRRNITNRVLMKRTGQYVDPEISDGILSYVSNFTNYTPPEDEYDSVVTGLEQYYATNDFHEDDGAELDAYIAEMDEQVKDVRNMVDSFELPEAYANAMTQYADWMESRKRQYEAFKLTLDDDFEQKAEEGRKLGTANVRGKGEGGGFDAIRSPGWFEMTDTEHDIYFALVVEKGTEAADQYYKDIEGSLLARAKTDLQEGARETAESGVAGRIFTEAVGIASVLPDIVTSVLYMGKNLITGENDKWLRLPAEMGKSAYSAVISAVEEAYKDDPIKKNVIKTVYEIAYNRGRSLVAGSAFGWVIPDGASDIIHAFPIATAAMADAIEEAYDNNATPTQAWILGAVSFISESFTEGIEFGHMESAKNIAKDLQSYTDFFKSLIPNMASEVLGETINDISERAFNSWVMGENSDREKEIQAYLDSGLVDTYEEAESMVMVDEFSRVLHTALVSALSPAGDTLIYTVSKAQSYLEYYKKAQKIRNNSLGEVNVTARSLRNGDIQLIKHMNQVSEQQDKFNLTRELKPLYSYEDKLTNPGVVSEIMREQQESEYEADLITLENAAGANATATSSSVSAVLRTGEGNQAQAEAAASSLGNVFGGNSVETLETVLYGGWFSGTNISTLKMGVQYAALADGECRRVMTSEKYQNASPEKKAQMLSKAVQADAGNTKVTDAVDAAVHESRVSAVVQRLMTEPGTRVTLESAEANVKSKAETTKEAQDRLETQQGVEQAKAEGMNRAVEEQNQDSEDPAKKDEVTRATNEYTKSTEVTDEYEKSVENAQKAETEAKEEARKTKERTMNEIRQKAEEIVADQDAQAAERKAQRDQMAEEAFNKREEARKAQEEAEAKEEAESGDAVEKEISRVLKEYKLDVNSEAAEQVRTQIRDRLSNIGKADENMNDRIDTEDGYKFLRRLSRKTGLTFQTADLGNPYLNRGYIVNGTDIVLNSNLSKGQVLVEAAFHEITHGLEMTEAYKAFSAHVIEIEYGGEDSDAYKDAIKKKIEQYAGFGVKLGTEKEVTDAVESAKKELVAEYSRQHLATKRFAQSVTAQGIGGKLRNAVRNAIQTLKGHTLEGDELTEYNNLRTSERLLTEAINERAKMTQGAYNGHTSLTQYSLSGVAEAAGLTIEAGEDGSYKYQLKYNGQTLEPNSFTADMVKNTKAGRLVDMTVTLKQQTLDSKLESGKITTEQYQEEMASAEKTAGEQRQFVADIVNMISSYQDAALVWELAGSLTFSSLKSNGDTQYGDSIDFGTICKKTQAILNVISETQVDLGRALTKDEIDGVVYEEVGKGVYNEETGKWEHGYTPCPVCYVYATWVNKPARLESVRLYQNECADWTDEQINEFMNRPTPVGKNETETKALTKDQNSKKLWIELCLADKVTDPQTGETKWTRKEEPCICPNDVLLDLRRSGDMATKYKGTWQFMQKGGNSQGKAIAPYSDSRLGETIVAKAKGADATMQALLEDARNAEAGTEDYVPQFMNPFQADLGDTESEKLAMEYLSTAIKKAAKQNLIGGQRWQSWSDFRAEWGSDYLMEMFTMQALGAKVQTYTKVAEAIDMMASAGFEVNLSGMPHKDGFEHNEDGSIKLDENGKPVLKFSNVTGIDADTAKAYVRKYGAKGNVQLMCVGISDQHILACLDSDDVTFVIPFHGSGGSVARVQKLMSLLGESMNTGNDYTKAQTDGFVEYVKKGEKKVNTNPNWDLRVKILTGYSNFTDAEIEALTGENANPYLKKLYEDRYMNEDSEAYHVWFTNDEANQIFPYEYWDTTTTLENADVNGDRFIEYCNFLGVIPRFSGVTKKAAKGKSFTEEDYGVSQNLVKDEKGNVIGYDYGNFSGAVRDASGKIIGYADSEGYIKDLEGNVIGKSETTKRAKGYWKLLIDRSMYNRVYDKNSGNLLKDQCTYHEPQAVNVANINVGAMPAGENNTVGYADDDVRAITERVIQRLELTNGQNAAANDTSEIAENEQIIQQAMYGDSNVQALFGGEYTDAEIDAMIAGSEYLDAVQKGDMETAQNMVDQKARESGYDVEYLVWRGDSEPYNVLEPGENGGNLGTGLYFTPNKSYAERFATKDNPVRKFYLKTNNTFDYDTFAQEFNDYAMSWLEENDMEPTMNVDEYTWSMIWDDFISENDLDSVKATGVGGVSYGASEISVQNSWQAKLADPVTYDDNGNVIPLNERFNDQENDIRYSMGGELTSAEIDDLALETGLIKPEDVGRTDYTKRSPFQRQFGAKTSQESEALHQEVRDYLYNHSDYTPDSNQSQINRAIMWVQGNASEGDESGYRKSVDIVCSDYYDSLTADGQARLLTVMAMAAQQGDIYTETRLADVYNKQGTEIGRALQARQIFRLMTPLGRREWANTQVNNLTEYYADKGQKVDITLSEDTLNLMANADTEEKIKAAQEKVYDELGSQMKPNWKDKLVAWRMFSMLSAPKTHIRNVVGNAVFVPAVGLKNRIAATLESGAQKVDLIGQGERTKTWKRATDEQKAFAAEDALAMQEVLNGQSKYDDRTRMQQNMKIFGTKDGPISQTFGKLLQKGTEGVSKALEWEDWKFLEGHYKRALSGWMASNNYTPEYLVEHAEVLQKGRTYAINEAQKATYRDTNAFASWLNKGSQMRNGWIIDAVMPFKKTPANIMMRGLQYSPVGLIYNLTADAAKLKRFNDYQNGKLNKPPKNAITPTQYIDRLSSGLAGTAITVLGAFMRNLGWATGSLREPEDELKKQQGHQSYALEIPGTGVSYTFDWAAPVCMPFFVGVEMMDQYLDEGFNFENLLDSLSTVTEPMMSLSMLEGVNSLFKTSQYDDTTQMVQIGAKIGANFMTSLVPTWVGQLTRVIDPTQRASFVESGESSGPTGTFRYAKEQAENKFIWWSTSNIPYRDKWGNTKQSNPWRNAFETLLSPGYISDLQGDQVYDEMVRLYDSTQNDKIIPSYAPKTVDVGGESIVLSAQEYDSIKAKRGQTAHELIQEMMGTDYWNSDLIDDGERVEIVGDIWSYATANATKDTFPDKRITGWTLAARTNPVQAMINKSQERIQKATISGYTEAALQALEDGDLDTMNVSIEGVKQAGGKVGDVKSAITAKYKERYILAYQDTMSNDPDTQENGRLAMREITSLLDSTGLGYKLKDYQNWLDKNDSYTRNDEEEEP